MKQYIKPKKISGQNVVIKDNSVSTWTLQYRLKGMTFGLAVAGVYNYLYLEGWSIKLIIAAGIVGYFLGWAVGRFYYTKR